MSVKIDDGSEDSFIGNPVPVLPPLPMPFASAPGLLFFENAVQASADSQVASSFGLMLMLDRSGKPLTISTASGVNASAFLDRSGNVIIAYQGTTTAAQTALDLQILGGANPSTVRGFADAIGFAATVQQTARAEGILPSGVYVAGYSLGGTLASLVASRTGLAGVSFASSGVPGYRAPAVSAANFVSYVDKGDPFANYGTDTAEKDSASATIAHMDRYGTVVQLGTAADAAELAPFAAAISGTSLRASESGDTPATPAQVGALTNKFFTLFGEHHGLNTYDADAAAATVPATAYGLQNTSMATMASLLSRDMPRLFADLSSLLCSPNVGATVLGPQSAFPDLASELTSVMHAASFGAALATLAVDAPAVAADLTSPARLGTVLAAIASDLLPVNGGGSTVLAHTSASQEIASLAALLHHVT